MKVLIIDNYDSFTYNLYQHTGEELEIKGEPFDLKVIRNDEWSFDRIKSGKFDRIIISPGPGHPADEAYFGISSKVILELGNFTPVMGVCLGMQGIAHLFGGKVVRAALPMHGKVSTLQHDGLGVFKGIPQDIQVMRYHSLVVDPSTIPEELQVTAKVENETGYEIMGLRHKKYPIEGIQFHPESFATEDGVRMLKNFLFPEV